LKILKEILDGFWDLGFKYYYLFALCIYFYFYFLMYVDEAKAIELKEHNTCIGFLIFSYFMIRKYNIMGKTNKNLKLI